MAKRCLSLLLILTGALTLSFPAIRGQAAPTLEKSKAVYIVSIKEAIMSRGLSAYIRRSVSDARAANAAFIIVEIDTPGGAVDITLDICDAIGRNNTIPSVAYVTGNAWSAGALITIACDKIYMAPNATIGSATPVGLSPQGQAITLGEKEVSAVRAKFRAWAETKHHSPALAVAMVDKDVEVKEVTIEGKSRFLTRKELDNEYIKHKDNPEVIQEGREVVSKGKLLNMTASTAKDYDFIDGVVSSRTELWESLGLVDPRVSVTNKSWSEGFFGFLASPMISGILLTIGMIGLYTEFKVPGFGLPGTVGIVCLALFFFSHYLVGLANYTEILLFLTGVVLLIIELFVTPGFGFLGASGIVLMLVGLFLALNRVSFPTEPWDVARFQNSLALMLVVVLAFLTAAIIIGRYLPATPYLKRLILTSTGGGVIEAPAPPLASAVGIGDIGVTASKLRPAGKATFGDRLVDVLTEGDFIEPGAKVKVLSIAGRRYIVREVAPPGDQEQVT